MSLPRLRLEECTLKDGRWLIDEKQAHHLIRVRRCSTGSLAEGLLSGERIELRLLCEDSLVFAEELSRVREEEPTIKLELILALLKNDQLDDSLRFAAETGASAIHLISCERSVPKYSGIRLEDKMSRWRKILAESTKQAGSASPTKLSPPLSLMELNLKIIPECRFAAILSPEAELLSKIEYESPAAIAIGPEGDWTDSEVKFLLDNNFRPVSLGKKILRASTAVAVSCGWFSLN